MAAMRRRSYVGVALLVVAAFGGIGTAEGAAKLYLRVVAVEPGARVSVQLMAADGTTQAFESEKASFFIDPSGGPGTYQLTIKVGDVTETASIEVPEAGSLTVVFDPAAPGSKISIRQGGTIESITVTAQRIEQSMQQVPVAITALTAKDLEEAHITNVRNLADATPNLWMAPNTGTNSGARAAIRGVGEDESMFTSDTPVGIYIDDVYIPRQTGAMFDLYDIERIEVLRGPQGSLYGRNTSAGAIKLITRGPGEELAGHLQMEAGNYSRLDARASVGGPLSDAIRFQIAGMIQHRDGYDKNLYNGKRVNDQQVSGARATLDLLPSDSVLVRFVGDLLKDRSGPGFPLGFVPQPPYVNGFGTGLPSFDHQLDGDSDPHTLLSDLENPSNDVDQYGISGTITWQASESVGLKSITSWRQMDNLLILDGDGQVGNSFLPGRIPTSLPLFHILQDQKQEQRSQELQLSGSIGDSVDYVSGLYYFHEENQQTTENAVLAPLGRNRYTESALETDSYALYGSLNWRLGATITLTAGGRYTRDTKDFQLVAFNPDGSPLYACVGPDGRIVNSRGPCGASAPPGSVNTPVEKFLKKTWSRVTPRVAISYAPRPDLLYYFDISTGFKSGAFDGRANEGATVLPLKPVPPEDITAYEAGLKSDLLDRRLRLNVAAFFTDFRDLQGTGTDPNGNFTRFSLGDVETKGIEIETLAMPASALELSANLALLKTEFTSTNFSQPTECGFYGTGDAKLSLKYAPERSYRLGVRYFIEDKLFGGSWSLGTSYSWRDDHYLGFCNAGAQTAKAYGVFDGVVAWDSDNGNWRVALTGRNLTNEAYLQGVFAIPGLRMVSGYIGPPRTYSVLLSYRF